MSRDPDDLKPRVRDLAFALIGEVQVRLKLTLVITSTLRTMTEQAELYAKGRTTPGPIVTRAQPGDSYHNFGLAFDVAILKSDGTVTWTVPEPHSWADIGKIGMGLGLTWGGNFATVKDYGHFELRADSLVALKSGLEA